MKRLPLLLLIVPLGCASAPHGEPMEAEAFQVLETLPAEGVLIASDLYSFQSGQWTCRVLEPEKAMLLYTVHPTAEFNAQVAQSTGEQRTEFWSRDEEDNIVMTAVIEHERDALTLFEPPLIIAPPELAAGEVLEDEVRMRVVDVENREQQRESGMARRTIEYVENQRIRTPLGEFTAKRIVIHFKADLSLAEAEDVTSYWVVPGRDVIAARYEEQIRVLGVMGSTSRRLVVRVGDDRVTR